MQVTLMAFLCLGITQWVVVYRCTANSTLNGSSAFHSSFAFPPRKILPVCWYSMLCWLQKQCRHGEKGKNSCLYQESSFCRVVCIHVFYWFCSTIVSWRLSRPSLCFIGAPCRRCEAVHARLRWFSASLSGRFYSIGTVSETKGLNKVKKVVMCLTI
jgi:hypothetical protein